MKIINPIYLVKKESWINPTISEINTYLNELASKLDIKSSELFKIWGVNPATVEKWKKTHKTNPDKKSLIKYEHFAILAALLEEPFIGNKIKTKKDLSEIPFKYFIQMNKVPVDILLKFIGQNSITGLSRSEFLKKLGWDKTFLNRMYSEGSINKTNWIFLLLSCDIDLPAIFAKCSILELATQASLDDANDNKLSNHIWTEGLSNRTANCLISAGFKSYEETKRKWIEGYNFCLLPNFSKSRSLLELKNWLQKTEV